MCQLAYLGLLLSMRLWRISIRRYGGPFSKGLLPDARVTNCFNFRHKNLYLMALHFRRKGGKTMNGASGKCEPTTDYRLPTTYMGDIRGFAVKLDQYEQ